MDWKVYEALIYEHLRIELPDAEILPDAKLPGHLSESSRQIDILVREQVAGQQVTTAVDAKFHSRPIDVKHVESFIGLLSDVGVERGLLVSKAGYTSTAYQRAFAEELDVDLDIFSLDEFQQWQAGVGIPFSGPRGVMLSAPLGWVVDTRAPVPRTLAALYQRGQSLKQAYKANQWAYVAIWHRKPPAEDLYELLELQAREKAEGVEGGKITSLEFPDLRPAERCAIRHFEAPHYPTVEISGFVEFEGFIFYAIMFTPLVVQRRNTRKLEHILRRVVPVGIEVERAS